MKQIFTLGILLLLLSACGQEKDETTERDSEFYQLVSAYEEEPGRTAAESIARYLLEDKSIFIEDENKVKEGMRLLATAYLREAFRQVFIEYLLQRRPEEIPDALLFVASVHEDELADPRVATFFYLNFVEEFPDHPKWDSIASKLPEDFTTTEELIAETVRGVFQEDGTPLSRVRANDFMLLAELYAISKPESPRAPDYLFHAAEVAKAFELHERSIYNSRWLVERFPEHEMAANALFFKAFTMDESGVNQSRALELYGDFLERYPDHPFAESAEVLKERGSHSEEQLLRMLRGGE